MKDNQRAKGSNRKPIAALSFDLDNQWSYMKTHGDPGWESFPSYLDLVVPRVLEFLKARRQTITFFVVGQDAALEKNERVLRAIARAGHEIGNHSFQHEPWLHLYSEEAIERDLALAEEHIERATGKKPIGFRGPGYGLSCETLKVLLRRGYAYDASTLPTFIGPLARLYYFMTAHLNRSEMKLRNRLFGTLRDGLRPIRPYHWQLGANKVASGLMEIPVTTMPIFRTPIHASYVLYLSKYSPALGLAYFKTALALCRLTRVPPSLLLHPLDFLGCDDLHALSFFPAMDLPYQTKMGVIDEMLKAYTQQFEVVTLRQYAVEVGNRAGLPVIKAEFGPRQIPESLLVSQA